MSQFRKKPIVIEAQCFGPSYTYGPDVVAWINENGGTARMGGSYSDPSDPGPAFMLITTLEGEMRADVGDYIIRGVNGEFYPCKPDIFAKTYDESDKPSDHGPFAYNEKPTAEMIDKMNHFRAAFAELYADVATLVPNSRERSLAITKLEEASFWLNKAITHPSQGQKT